MPEYYRIGKLAVILHADVAGSTALVQLDERLAHERIQQVFHRFADIISQYHGRVQELRGDALLAEFERASDAVTAALAFQESQTAYLRQIKDDLKPEVRVGIAMGEVIIADNTMTGAGVVLAQRVEQLAEPGAVLIQSAAYETIPGRFPYEYRHLGEYEAKGFDKPVQVYIATLKGGNQIPEPEQSISVRRKPILAVVSAVIVIAVMSFLWFKPVTEQNEPATVEQIATPLPDKPSIAVLPFNNMSGQEEQEYFVDGMTEDLITDLSKLSGLFVISRNSMFTYKGKVVKAADVAQDLGVRYILEGSVRRVGDQVRINAQLIDASTRGHLWAERYDGTLTNIFELQDQVTGEIVSALSVELADNEKTTKSNTGTHNPDAYDAYLKGWFHYQRQTPEDFAQARDLIEQALALDPEYSQAYAALAAVYWEAHLNWWMYALKMDTPSVRNAAHEYRDKALQNPTPLALIVDSDILLGYRRHDEALRQARIAIELAPNDAHAHVQLAKVLVYAGKPLDSLESLAQAARLDPYGENRRAYVRGLAEFGLSRFEDAAATMQRALEMNPGFAKPTAVMVAAQGYLGQSDAARLLKPYEDQGEWWANSVNNAGTQFPYQNPEDLSRFENGLRKAGLRDVF